MDRLSKSGVNRNVKLHRHSSSIHGRHFTSATAWAKPISTFLVNSDNTDIFLNQLIQFYSNNATNLHHLTTHSTTVLSHIMAIILRHSTLCIEITHRSILGFLPHSSNMLPNKGEILYRGHAKFYLHWCSAGGMRPQNCKFYEIWEYRACCMHNTYKTFRVCE